VMSLRSYPCIVPRQPNTTHDASVDQHPVPALMMLQKDVPWVWYPIRAAVMSIAAMACFTVGIYKELKYYLGFAERPTHDTFGQPFTKGPMCDLNTPVTQEGYELMHSWAMYEDSFAYNKFVIKNASCVPNIVSGKIHVNASGIKEIVKDTVYFNDGRKQSCDVILACVGYDMVFPFLEDKMRPKNSVRDLYFHMLHPDPDLISLSFIGFARPSTGGIPICSELQARYWSLLLAGQRTLPSDVAERACKQAKREEEALHLSKELKAVVLHHEYSFPLAMEIGCTPKPADLWKHGGLSLILKALTSNTYPNMLRLSGPGAMPEEAMKGMRGAVSSVNALTGAKYLLQNALIDLGIMKATSRGYTYETGPDGTWFHTYFYKECGASKLSAPDPKWRFDARHDQSLLEDAA